MARTTTIEPLQLTPKDDAKQEPLLNQPGFLYQTVKQTIQELLEAEMTAFLGAESRERTPARRGYRSGHRLRSLATRVGRIWFDLPCERSGGFKTRLLGRYQRSEQAFLLALQEMYLQGVSTRRVQKITEQLCSLPISASEVSRITAQLDQTLETWRRRRLTEPYLALLVDARYERIRNDQRVNSVAVVTIIGISGKTGRRELLGVYVVNAESMTSWGEVFRDLLQRGLQGVEVVTSDAHEGLLAAQMKYFPGSLWQHCQRHFNVNARDKVYKYQRKELTFDLHSIFDACDLEHAQVRVREVVAQWRPRNGELADWLEANIEFCLSCFHFPPSFRTRIRSTNLPERFNEELKRRSEIIRVFPNAASCLRLMTALALEQNEVWAEQPPYLDIKDLAEWEKQQAPHMPVTNPKPENTPPETPYCRTFGT